MKEFFSKKYFKELKTILILQIFIAILASILLSIPSNIALMELNHISLFSPFALLISLFIWAISSIINKEKYFNFVTFIVSIFFSYSCFWFMFEIMMQKI